MTNTTYLIWIIGKNKLEPTIIWHTGLKFKNTRPRWVDNCACGTVRWYWSADTLFWQLSIDDNIDVQLVFSWAPKLARVSVRVNIGFPVVQTDGRCTVTWLPNFLGWVDYDISLAMGLRPRAAPLNVVRIKKHSQNQIERQWSKSVKPLLHNQKVLKNTFQDTTIQSWRAFKRTFQGLAQKF